jgi:hypothetical protein
LVNRENSMETIVAGRRDSGPVYQIALLLQVPCCPLILLALTGWKQGSPARVANAAFARIVLNASAGGAFANFLTGSKEVGVR